MIPYSRQEIDTADIKAVMRVLKERIITRGPLIRTFEEALAKEVGAKYAVAFTSGTAALQGAYFAAGVGKGDEVITSPLTFASTANAALWAGAKIVFADIDESGNIDPRAVAKKITKRTRAIAPVDYGGRPADSIALRTLTRKHGLVLIEDAVHALGGSLDGKKIGSIADLSTFSFHPVKPLTMGEGGAVTTNSKEFYGHLLRFRNHGMTRDRALFEMKDAPPWHYEMLELGINSWITDFQAALGISQLKKLDRFTQARRVAAERYQKLLVGIDGLILPNPDTKESQSAWHLYPVRVPVNKRRALFEALIAADIGVQVHYIPVYLHPYYKKLGYKKGLCPRAEAFYESELSLPLFPSITVAEQKHIVTVLKRHLN